MIQHTVKDEIEPDHKKKHIHPAPQQQSAFPVIKTVIQHTVKDEIEPDHKKIMLQIKVGFAATP